MVFPLLVPGTHVGGYYLNTGQTWEHYLVPTAALVAMLLLPAIARMRLGPVEIEPRAPEPPSTPDLEPRLPEPQAISSLEPRLTTE
ncbi:MAG: hypothetical protein HYX99_04685 [Chloroflexi bacterium]|nr:hypothetical protein [Chloroflexota bacterium]